jgi:hypothetical protein
VGGRHGRYGWAVFAAGAEKQLINGWRTDALPFVRVSDNDTEKQTPASGATGPTANNAEIELVGLIENGYGSWQDIPTTATGGKSSRRFSPSA